MAREKLSSSQRKIKSIFIQHSARRVFTVGDCILALLLLVTSPFQVKFSGPYEVSKRLFELNYIIYFYSRLQKGNPALSCWPVKALFSSSHVWTTCCWTVRYGRGAPSPWVECQPLLRLWQLKWRLDCQIWIHVYYTALRNLEGLLGHLPESWTVRIGKINLIVSMFV